MTAQEHLIRFIHCPYSFEGCVGVTPVSLDNGRLVYLHSVPPGELWTPTTEDGFSDISRASLPEEAVVETPLPSAGPEAIIITDVPATQFRSAQGGSGGFALANATAAFAATAAGEKEEDEEDRDAEFAMEDAGTESSNKVEPLSLQPLCQHTNSWHRLRGKRGNGYYVCHECGAKWKTISKDRRHKKV